MADPVSELVECYLRLAWAIEQHFPGYVDAYFGPAELQEEARAAGPRPLAELARECAELAAGTAAADLDAQRRAYLAGQVRAMATALRILQGANLGLAEEAEALYGVHPAWIEEAVFVQAHEVLAELLPGAGPPAGRMRARQAATEIAVALAEPLLAEIIGELRSHTQQRFWLPEGESFELRVVSDQPWRAYNWYLGSFRSRIDINMDLPLHINDLAVLLAHEGYPGHHTEGATKEARLVRQQGRLEHTVALLYSPAAQISEGIAVRALPMLMSNDELAAWYAERIFPRAGFGHLDARREVAIDVAGRALRGVQCNAAFMLHDRGATPEEVLDYLQRWALVDGTEARQMLRFIDRPLERAYVFNYTFGGALLDELFAAHPDRDRWFARLLAEPVTPGQVREWIAAADRGRRDESSRR